MITLILYSICDDLALVANTCRLAES